MLDRYPINSASSIAQAIELITANIDNPTELNAIGTAVEDLRLVHENVAGSDRATLYRLDTSSDAVNAPYIMASATAGLQWVAIAGYAQNQSTRQYGHVALGNTAAVDATYVLYIKDTYAGAAAVYRGLRVETTHPGAVASASTGIDIIHSTSGSNAIDHIVGVQSRPVHGSSGTLTWGYGLWGNISTAAAGAGTVTNAAAIYASTPVSGGSGSFTNAYGLYVEDVTAGATLNYGIYSAGPVYVAKTTASTSQTTGALTVAGGMGVAGRVYATRFVAGDGTTAAGAYLIAQAPAGQEKAVIFNSGSLARWQFGAGTTAESGGNAGSQFLVQAYDDAGASIDTPITILRVSGGLMTFARPVSVTSTTDSSSVSTGSIVTSGGIGIAKSVYCAGLTVVNTTSPTLLIDGPAGQNRLLRFQTSAGNRWAFACSNAAEAGANAGSGFQVIAYDDSGSLIDIPITITRASGGGIASARPWSISSTTDSTTTATGSFITSGGLGVAKNLIHGKGHGVGVTSTASAAGTTTLTSASTTTQILTGVTTQTYTLPAANVFGANIGARFMFKNLSTGLMTIQRAGADTINTTANVTSFTVASFASVTLVSDGVSAWNTI